jgi:hypothetical protein
MGITEYAYLLATDRHGSVYCSKVRHGSIAIGGGIPLGIPPDRSVLPDYIAEAAHRIDASATAPEFLGAVEHEGLIHHVFFVSYLEDMIRGRPTRLSPSGSFVWRWFIEREHDSLTDLSKRLWELIEDRPYEQPEFPEAAAVGQVSA